MLEQPIRCVSKIECVVTDHPQDLRGLGLNTLFWNRETLQRYSIGSGSIYSNTPHSIPMGLMYHLTVRVTTMPPNSRPVGFGFLTQAGKKCQNQVGGESEKLVGIHLMKPGLRGPRNEKVDAGSVLCLRSLSGTNSIGYGKTDLRVVSFRQEKSFHMNERSRNDTPHFSD